MEGFLSSSLPLEQYIFTKVFPKVVIIFHNNVLWLRRSAMPYIIKYCGIPGRWTSNFLTKMPHE